MTKATDSRGLPSLGKYARAKLINDSYFYYHQPNGENKHRLIGSIMHAEARLAKG
jgi:hypothetical protein